MSTPTVVPILRAARVDDVGAIYELLEDYASRGELLPRPVPELYRNIRDFFVLDDNGKIVGCGALEVFTRELGEVRSLVVAPDRAGEGLGRVIVDHIISEAKVLGLGRLMALTYVPDFFNKLGFEIVPKETLPEKVWGVCVKCYKFDNCDEIAVLLRLAAHQAA